MNLTEIAGSHAETPGCPLILRDAVYAACRRLAPLWPLKHFVAVNPFVGLTDRPYIDTCELIRRVAPGGMQMTMNYYREKYRAGTITDRDLAAALVHGEQILTGPWADALTAHNLATLKLALDQPAAVTDDEILTVAEIVDRRRDTDWLSTITEAIGHFCSAYYDEGQSAWRLPWKSLPLFSAWREMASLDISPELLGLHGFRQRVAALPDDAMTVIEHSLTRLAIPDEAVEDFLHKQLMSIRGWAGYAQYRVRQNGMYSLTDASLVHLLAIRLTYEAALLDQYDSPEFREFWPAPPPASASSTGVLVRFLWQLADEHAWQRTLLHTLRTAAASDATPDFERPSVQAVFCIDVRSEIFRRALEAASPKVETIGFAGFFGVPLEYIPLGQHQGASHCPVLLTPKIRVREALPLADPEQQEAALRKLWLSKRVTYSWSAFKTSAISCFSFVETAGIAAGAKLFRNAFAPAGSQNIGRQICGPAIEPTADTGISLSERIQLAMSALKNMGLTKSFGRLVLLCGHGSATVNNPYGSGLDCGACGGHAGDANARIAAMILNDPAVRVEVGKQGIPIPEDTWFLAGLHNTTTDDVTLFDLGTAPASHHADIADLEQWLAAAGRQSRRERAVSLGLDNDAPGIDEEIRLRSWDWAQTRPEWGLAGNAAFIAAPRERTKGVRLGGRTFLHSYDYREDADNSILELIMSAPMVVANWINLQYYASTVNNGVFGSGNKVIHNVIGTLGVCQGNSGDLQTGLPLQSVHDGRKWMHEPLRLHVLIEAPRERIETVLTKHEGVRQLVENGWVLLFAVEDQGSAIYRHHPGGKWERTDEE